MSKKPLPRGITATDDGRLLARRSHDGHRQRRTFDTLEDAIAWRTGTPAETPTTPTPTPTKAAAAAPAKNKPSAAAPASPVTDAGLPPGIYKLDNRPKPYQVKITRRKKRYTGTFVTLDQATAWIEAIDRALFAGVDIPPPESVYTEDPTIAVRLFGEAAAEWLPRYIAERRASNKGMQPNSVQKLRDIIDNLVLPTFANRPLRDVTVDEVSSFRCYLAGVEKDLVTPRTIGKGKKPQPGYGTGTQGKSLWIVRQVFNFAKARGWCDIVPVDDTIRPIRPPNPRREPHEAVYVEPVVAVALSKMFHEDNRPVFWIQRLCGLRISEVFGLRVKDVDLVSRIIRVEGQGGQKFLEWGEGKDRDKAVESYRVTRTKTPAGLRLVGIPEILVPLLQKTMDEHGANPDPDEIFVFQPRGGNKAGTTGFQASLTREARRLGVWTATDDPAESHDLRKSFSTDLDLAGIPSTLRSIIMGHQIAGAIEGSAAITHSTYTLRSPHIQRITAAADTFNDFFLEQASVAGTPVSTLIFDDELTANWMRADDAADLMNMGGENLIGNYIKRGRLTAKKERHPNKNTPNWWVLRSEVEALIELRESRVSLAEAMRRTGLHDQQLLRIVRSNNLELHKDMDGNKPITYLSVEDWERLMELVGVNDEFLSTHVQFVEAAEMLKCKTDTLRRWIAQGDIEEATPPLPGFNRINVRWLSRQSIESAKSSGLIGFSGRGRKKTHGKRQNEIRESEHYTLQEAARICKLSSAHVRTLANRGVLEKVAGTGGKGTGVRTLVTKESVDAYASANRQEANNKRR